MDPRLNWPTRYLFVYNYDERWHEDKTSLMKSEVSSMFPDSRSMFMNNIWPVFYISYLEGILHNLIKTINKIYEADQTKAKIKGCDRTNRWGPWYSTRGFPEHILKGFRMGDHEITRFCAASMTPYWWLKMKQISRDCYINLTILPNLLLWWYRPKK